MCTFTYAAPLAMANAMSSKLRMPDSGRITISLARADPLIWNDPDCPTAAIGKLITTGPFTPAVPEWMCEATTPVGRP